MSRKWPRRRAKARSDLPRARNGNRQRRSRSVGCAPTTGKCSACIKGSRHLGAQTRPTDTLSPTAREGTAGHVGSMKPKLTLKQACFQGYPESAVYVQIPVGSRNSASRNAYHTSLRPSSLFEPRHPSLKVVRKRSPCGGRRRQGSKSTTRKGSSRGPTTRR